MNTRDLGEIGEEAAVNYLTELGYTILDRNWQCGHHEIDIVALDGEFLVIVEVKLRDYNSLITPSDAVDRQKQRNLISVANGYLRYKHRTEEIRMDIVSVVHHNAEILSVEHIQNAFYPSLRSR